MPMPISSYTHIHTRTTHTHTCTQAGDVDEPRILSEVDPLYKEVAGLFDEWNKRAVAGTGGLFRVRCV